jgi:post-segregation antitoxin (ccd killing protein)
MRLQVEIKDTLYEQCRLVAQTRGINLSALVREALEDAIDPDKVMAAKLWKENDERLDPPKIDLAKQPRLPVRIEQVQKIQPVALHEVSLVPDTQGNREAGTRPVLAIGHERPISSAEEFGEENKQWLVPGVVKGKDFQPVPKPTRKPRGK